MTYKKHQREAKARFWLALGDNYLGDASQLGMPEVVAKAGTQNVRVWLEDAEFEIWFFRPDCPQVILRAAADSAVTALWGILENLEEKASAKIAAAKIILEYGGFAPAKTKIVKYKDEEIDKLSPEELDKFIADRDLKSVK